MKTATRHSGGARPQTAGVFALLLLALGLLIHGGCETTDPFGGPNHPPNTVFIDGDPYETPAPDTLIEEETVTFWWTGTDQDGDQIVASYYRLSPPDTEWTRIPVGTLVKKTFTDLTDTTYEFCVFVQDERGAVDPEPTCRRFSVDAYHLGEIFIDYWISDRDSLLHFEWGVKDTEIPPESLQIFIHPHIMGTRPGGLPDTVIDAGQKYETTATDTVIFPGPCDEDICYHHCISVFAQPRGDSLRALTPKRLCVPEL